MINLRRLLLLIACVGLLLGCSQNQLYAQWTSSSGGISYSSGNVGIGTNTPNAKLDVFPGGDNTNLKFEGATGKLVIWPYYNYNGNNYGALLDSINAAESSYMPMALIGSTLNLNTNGGSINLNGGNVGIGTTNPQHLLSVSGTIQAKEVIVNTGWSDYVFAPTYHLRSLESTAAYVKEHRHLPDMPSEAEVKEKGVSVGEVESKLLAKVEELTLQMIKLNETNKQLADRLAQMEDRKRRGEHETAPQR